MHNTQQHVQVFIRIKPTDHFAAKNIELLPNSKELLIHASEENSPGCINNRIVDWKFRADGILHNISQDEVYKTCSTKQVSLALDGYNTTLFSYGQTGAGKTYTMTGTTNNFQHRGIIPRAINQLFTEAQQKHEYDIKIRVSYLEIYKEQMFDLLSTMEGAQKASAGLSIAEDAQGTTYVKGLTCMVAKTEEEALNYLFEGESNRIISQHQLNHLSSRSHCIFTLHIESYSKTQSETKFIRSKFNLVDLAGSERLGKTLSQGETQKEATYINKSLTFLEQTIIALQDKNRRHIPYRQSKLTHFLKDSLGGRCYTVMIGNIWGEKEQLEETLSTLRFATRVMSVPSQPAVNTYQDPAKLCQKYDKEISHLRKELAMYDTLTNRNQVNYEPLSDVQIRDIRQQVRKYLDNDITDIEVVNLRQVQEIFAQFKYFVENVEKEAEKRLKEKYTMVEKGEANELGGENLTAATERQGLVGENDGNNFSVGRVTNGVKPAAPSAAVAARKRTKKIKENPADNERKNSSVIPNTASVQGDAKSIAKEPSVASVSANQADGHSPPGKEEGFLMFKVESGSTLNKVFLENKEILCEKKREAKQLSDVINRTKHEIDETKEQLNVIQESKEYQQEMTSTGEVIIEEEEYKLLRCLKSAKSQYRENYEQLQKLRADIAYCGNLVKQCRQKLLLEFETWYSESFSTSKVEQKDAIDSRNADSASKHLFKVVFQPKEDDGVAFNRIQKEALMKEPESLTFYNARIQTERRKLYGGTIKEKRPGSVTSSLRNAPPKSMLIH